MHSDSFCLGFCPFRYHQLTVDLFEILSFLCDVWMTRILFCQLVLSSFLLFYLFNNDDNRRNYSDIKYDKQKSGKKLKWKCSTVNRINVKLFKCINQKQNVL